MDSNNPPGRGPARAAAGRGRGRGGRGAAAPAEPPPAARPDEDEEDDDPPAADPVDDLTGRMGAVALIPPFRSFSMDILLPFRIQSTGFVGGHMWCYVDLGIPSISDRLILIDLGSGGMVLSSNVAVLPGFVEANRIFHELQHLGVEDVRAAAYLETSNRIYEEYPRGQMIFGAPQLIRLPFPCQQDFERETIWNPGDDILRDEFFEQNLPPQMMAVHRVTLRSTETTRTSSTVARTRAVNAARDWATPPSARGPRPGPRPGPPPGPPPRPFPQPPPGPRGGPMAAVPEGAAAGSGAEGVRGAGATSTPSPTQAFHPMPQSSATAEQQAAAAAEMDRVTKQAKRAFSSVGSTEEACAREFKKAATTAKVTPGKTEE